MLEKVLAGIVAAICLALLLRMVLPAPQQARWDRWWRRRAEQARALGHRTRHQAQAVRQGARTRVDEVRHGAQARREADEVIARARRPRPDVTRDGNVIRPGRFGRGSGADGGDNSGEDPDRPGGRPPTLH